MFPNGDLIKYRFKSKMLTWRRVAGEKGIDWFDFLVFWKVREHVIKTCILSGQSAKAFIPPPTPLAVSGHSNFGHTLVWGHNFFSKPNSSKFGHIGFLYWGTLVGGHWDLSNFIWTMDIYMFLKPANSDTEKGIKKKTFKSHFLKGTRIIRP